MDLHIKMNDEPIAKGRARGFAFGGLVRMYTPKPTRSYEERLRTCATAAASAAGWSWTDADRFALEVKVYRTHHLKGGDLDNYVKACADALNKIAFPDDRRVFRLVAELHRDAANPRVEITVSKIARTT